MPPLIYTHAIMLAISEFKQLKLRLPEVLDKQTDGENEQNELLNLAKKHLNQLKSMDVCLLVDIIQKIIISSSIQLMSNHSKNFCIISSILPKVHLHPYVQPWVDLLVNKY